MTQEFLDMADFCAVFHHVGGAGMTKSVSGDVFLETGKDDAAFYDGPDGVGCHFVTPAIEDDITAVFAFEKGRTD